jgi:hypothetical protein
VSSTGLLPPILVGVEERDMEPRQHRHRPNIVQPQSSVSADASPARSPRAAAASRPRREAFAGVSMEPQPDGAIDASIAIEWQAVDLGDARSSGCTIVSASGHDISVVVHQGAYQKTVRGAGRLEIAVVPLASVGTPGALVVRDEVTGATAKYAWRWQANHVGEPKPTVISWLKRLLARGNATATQVSTVDSIANVGLDLNGLWTGDYHNPGRIDSEVIQIVHRGGSVVATKVVGDDFVPTGQVTWRATVTGFSGDGEGQVAEHGYRDARFLPGRLTVLDQNHLVFEWSGSDSVTYTRQ